MSDKDRTTISREARVIDIISEFFGADEDCDLECMKTLAKKILAMLDERDKALYQATNKLMARLGAEGQIDTVAIEVDNVMNALHDIDGGEGKV